MLHWINRDAWGPIWPNLAASAIIFIVGFAWAKRKMLAKWEEQEKAHVKRHQELKAMLDDGKRS